MRKNFLSRTSIVSINFLIIIIDQLSKFYASNNLEEGITRKLIPNLIQLTLVKNTGAAFGIFPRSSFALGIVSLIVSISLLVWIIKKSHFLIWEGLAVAFLLGGSIGNGIDRWMFGYVTDFIQITHIDFPVFNVADISINFAIIFFFINANMSSRKRHNQS